MVETRALGVHCPPPHLSVQQLCERLAEFEEAEAAEARGEAAEARGEAAEARGEAAEARGEAAEARGEAGSMEPSAEQNGEDGEDGRRYRSEILWMILEKRNSKTQHLVDELIDRFSKYIWDNLKSNTSSHRDDALMLLGTLMKGSDPEAVHALITDTAPALIERLKDEDKSVRESACWAIGEIAHYHLNLNFPSSNLASTIFSLIDDEPSVAAQACVTLNDIIGRVPELITAPIVERLFKTATLPSSHLSRCACETLCTTVMLAHETQLPNVPNMLKNLVTFLNDAVSSRSGTCDDYSGLVTTVGALFSKVSESPRDVASTIVRLMITIGTEGKYRGVMAEEAVRCLGTVATTLGSRFKTYQTLTIDLLVHAIQTCQDENVCGAAVEALGDVCRAVGHRSENIHIKVFSVLTRSLVECPSDDVKTKILYCIGDLAITMDHDFKVHFRRTMEILGNATKLCFDDETPNALVCDFRHAVLHTYQACVLSLGDTPEMLKPFASVMVAYISDIVRAPESSEENLCKAADLASDLTVLFINHLNAEFRDAVQGVMSQLSNHKSETVNAAGTQLGLTITRYQSASRYVVGTPLGKPLKMLKRDLKRDQRDMPYIVSGGRGGQAGGGQAGGAEEPPLDEGA